VTAAVLVAVALVGCGGGDESGLTSAGGTETTAERPSPPEPTQPLSEQIPVFERAAAHPSCDAAIEVIHPVMFPDPDHPTSKSNCSDILYPLRAESGVEVNGSQELGTGAVVDTSLNGKEESLIWALDQTGRFKWTGSFIATAAPGAQWATETQYQRTADALVEALRHEDCHAAFETLASASRIGQDGEEAFCDGFDANFTATPEGLASRLEEDADAEPVLVDTTANLAVFGLATVPAGYRTLIVGAPRPDAAPVVIDAVPVER
jgi:hypothetical protein